MKKLFLLMMLLSIVFPVFSKNDEIQQFDSIADEVDKIGFCHGKQARLLVEQLYQIAKKSPDQPQLQVRSLYHEAFVNYSQGTNDSTLISRIKYCFLAFQNEPVSFEKSLLNYSLTISYVTKGDYAEAFQSALLSLEQFEQIHDTLFIAKTLNTLGNICDNIRNYKLAEDYYKQSRAFSNQHQKIYFKSMLDLYTCYSREEPQKDFSIDSLHYFISIFEQYQDTGLLAVAYLNIGACYSIKGDHQQAYRFYSELLELIKTIDNNKLTIVLYQNLGLYYSQNKDFEKANRYFQVAKTIAEYDENFMRLSYVLTGLSYMYEQMGNVDSAFFYMKEYNLLNNKLLNNSKAIDAYRAYITMLLESSKKELKIAEQALLLKNRRMGVIIIAAVIIVILVMLLFIIVQQKKRQQTLIKESETRDLSARLKHEQNIKQLHENQHKKALELKVREIASYSLLLSEKNTILQQITSLTIHPAKNQSESEKINEQINRIIKTNLNTEREWENFMIHFDKVHPSFFEKLKTYCNDLTENNLRLCAYFRIGLSIKEVAKILNVSHETAKTSRYRLKRKLGLPEDESLDDFLRGI